MLEYAFTGTGFQITNYGNWAVLNMHPFFNWFNYMYQHNNQREMVDLCACL